MSGIFPSPSDLPSPPALDLTMSLAVSKRILIFSKGFLSGMTSTTLVTSAFLAAGAGAGVPQENGSFLVVDVLVPHEENTSLLDVVPDAGASNLKGSLLGAGEVPQPLLLEVVPKMSVVVLCLVFPEEANGSLVSPQFVVVEVPKGSVLLFVVVVANGSFVLVVVANGSLLLVEANGSLELLLSQLPNPVEAGAGAGVSKPKPLDPPGAPNPPDCCEPFFQLK